MLILICPGTLLRTSSLIRWALLFPEHKLALISDAMPVSFLCIAAVLYPKYILCRYSSHADSSHGVFLVYLLKTRITEREETSIAREQHVTGCFLCDPRHVSTGTAMHTTVEELLEAVFSTLSAPRLHKELNDRPRYTRRHWVPFSLPPTTRRATVEVFEPASTLARTTCPRYTALTWTAQKTSLPLLLSSR
jgi:hypothetical protein